MLCCVAPLYRRILQFCYCWFMTTGSRPLYAVSIKRATLVYYSALPISGQPNFTKFAHKTWICEVVNPFGTKFSKSSRKGSPSIANSCGAFQRRSRVRYNSAGSERILMKFGALQVYCLERALADFGRDPRKSKSGSVSRNFVFSQVNNARRYQFPVSQSSRNLHTRRGSARW